jgi:hypothetical protein
MLSPLSPARLAMKEQRQTNGEDVTVAAERLVTAWKNAHLGIA